MPNADELARELDEVLSDDEENPALPPSAPSTRDSADRRARSLRRVLDDITTIDELAETRIKEINGWRHLRTAPLRARADWLMASLIAFAKVRKEQTGGPANSQSEKSQRFTSGVEIKLTPPKGSLVMLDEGAFMEWAKVNAPDLIVTPPAPAPTIDKVETKKRFALSKITKPVGEEDEIELIDEDGESVPGVVIRRSREDFPAFTIKPIDTPDGEA